jgi:para-nitrobenzyl esterase
MQVIARRHADAFGAIAALAVTVGPAAADSTEARTAVVGTQSGAVRGVTDGRSDGFLGLPYVAPPVRELRFAPPAEPAKWMGVRVADRQSPACLQFEPTGVREEQAVSEDCRTRWSRCGGSGATSKRSAAIRTT